MARSTPAKKNRRNGQRNKSRGSAGLPAPSSAGQSKLVFNPTWNPQALKVMRTFQYSSPAADFGAGFGIVQDPAVGASTTNLNYTTGALSFRVGDVYNVTEFGVLYDQYRIAAVRLRFDYISASETVLPTAVNGVVQQCTLVLYEDFDDSTAPTASNAGWQSIMESGRARKKVFPNKTNFLDYTVYPKYLTLDVDNSGGTTGRSLGSGWLDGSTTPDVIHRGIKYGIQCNPAPVTMVHTFRITADYYLQFRNRQ